jgi:hypothetical protein
MSKAHPECPLSDHQNCRHCDNPSICALVREDKTCQRNIGKKETPKEEIVD